jgi:serine/threonine protein kinase
MRLGSASLYDVHEVPADAGIRFGQYVLVRRIARGGMAEVFLAQQRGLEGFDRRVAVKRILPHLADSPDFVKMFLGEAKLAAQLAHPNIVHIYEFGKVANDYFIAMEFVEGVHAGELFRQGEVDRLSPTLVARIGADTAAALNYAHELRNASGKLYGLVHRDVSPANIMISYDGIVKLCDFGIAKAAAVGDPLTNAGQVKGKYAYMSPEQTTASQLDGRSDVFALGIVLWELLTGKYIVPRGDAITAMRMIRDGKLEPIERAAPSTPAPLARAIASALELKRENRATAAELTQSLEAFIKSSPEIATSMQLAQWIRPRFPRESMMNMEGPSSSPGTHASPRTAAAPHTASVASSIALPPGLAAGAPTMLPVTPSVYPPRTVVKVVEDTGEGTEIYSVSDLQDGATIQAPRFRPQQVLTPSDAATMISRPHNPADEATVHAGPPIMTGHDATAVVDARHLPRPTDDDDSQNNSTFMETTERDRRHPIPSGPTVVPTRIPPPPPHAAPDHRPSLPSPLRGMQLSPDSRSVHTIKGTGTQSVMSRRSSQDMQAQVHAQQRQRTVLTPDQMTKQRRKKLFVTIGGLGGLMLLSFLVALCASGGGRTAVAPGDASVIRMSGTDATLPLATPPVDAAAATLPTVPTVPATETSPDAAMATLIVRTIPDGATINVGDQTRQATVQPGDETGAATAQLLVAPGAVTVLAALDGYRPESREVTLENGETKTVEITFTKKIRTGNAPMGRLTVKTTPWSDVYLGGKKLGQAPFTDLEVPVGTHTLTFKNPSRPTVVKTVTVKVGKTAKLSFNLP